MGDKYSFYLFILLVIL